MNTAKQKTCAELVDNAANSRLESIRMMINPQLFDVELIDDGTLDTVLRVDDEEFRFDADVAMAYRDGDTGKMVELDEFIEANMDEIRETMYERFCEYGLSFDYVEPHTFTDQAEGYLRYQISCGGPSEEIRFYVSPAWHGFTMYKAEFWYLDWFDGACKNVTDNETVKALFDHFNDCESVSHAIREAGE